MKYYNHLLILLFSLMGLSTFAQTSKKTLNYQAVILDPKAIDIPGASITGQPLNKGNVCLRFSLLNAQGGLDYEETQQVTTDEYGLVNVAIGTGTQAQAGNSTSIYKSFESVVWNSSVKSLKVSVSYDGCSSFKQVSAQALNYTPYALYAEAVDYKNVREAPTKLSQFSNDAGYLILKDLDPLKSDIQTNSSKIEVANKSIADNKQASDATFLVLNQSITSLDTQVAQNTGSISNINTKITDQQNQILDNRNQISATNNNLNNQIGGLQGQINNTNSTVSNLSGAAEVVSNKSTAVDLGGTNPSDQSYPSQKAAKAYVDQVVSQIATTGVPDATTLAAGKLQLAGDLSGTATSPTVPALAGKENSSNKSTNVQTDAASDTKYPSVKAVKTYVDQAVNGTALQATVDGKADKLSPTFTGAPTAPTPASTDNSTKLATTAFVQAATAGIALQAAVDAKADKNSPTFTGTPSLPTGTTGVTQTLGDNSTKLATTKYVDAQVAAGAPEASTSSKGIIQLTGGLGGTASLPTVPGLTLKEDLTNKSTAADLGASLASDEKYPTQNAVKTYVDNKIATATIADASSTSKGKLQLAGDLAGTNSSASAPVISNGAINSAKIEDRSIATDDIADLAITNVKIAGVAGSKVTGNIPGNAENVNGTVAVGNGGTGATNLTGYVKGNGTSAMTTVSSIPVADVAGAVRKVNGSSPNASGEVSILFGRVTSGNYANVPTSGGVNGDIYIVSGDGNASNNGRTFIKDDVAWNEVSPNTAAADARYLQLGGGVMEGSLSIPSGKTLTLTDAPSGSTDAANKAYVDGKIASEVPNASTSVVGKIKLAGDLRGTYDAPTVPGLELKAPKENPAFTGTVTGITSTMVGLGNVDNTSDANKPVSNATITALSLKAPIASPSFTGTVSGITKAMVDLANVDNTSDANKPISTATASSLSAKENSNNKSTATDLGASIASDDKFPTQKAVKTYVDASVSSGAPDADASTKGKIQLAGDLSGSAASPSIATGAITSAKIADGTIINDDISSSAAIVDSKLATIATANKVSNSATTATNSNTASAIVARDANGNFSAGTITANLTGNASTATSATSFSGSLTGDVTGTQSATVVGKINGISLAGLNTGLLKNTTVTGAPSIASAGTDYSAGTSALGTGILKSTTTTGALSIAQAVDFPTLNQNTTGNAATATKLATSRTINGTAFDGSSDITVSAAAGTLSGTTLNSSVVSSSLTSVGTLTNLTVTNPITGSVSGTAANVTGTVGVANGGTGATTAGGALTALGAQATANLSTDISTDAASTTKYPAVKTIKEYVDASVTSGAPDASTTNLGKIKLANDLTGTAALPAIAAGAITTAKLAADAVTSAKILDGEIVNADISTTAAIVDTKLGTIATTGKVSNSATTAASANTASAIVARDALGNFSAGTITAAGFSGPLTGTVTGNASTASKLAATKNINGIAFDGSSDITVTAAAGTLSGTSMNSTVVSSSLTSVGTLTDLTITNDITVSGLTMGNGVGNGTTNAESTAMGAGALMNVGNTGGNNTAYGYRTLYSNTNGANNTAVGGGASNTNAGGNNNVAMGSAALYNNVSGSANVAIGKSAGQYMTGSKNTAIGAYSDMNAITYSNATAIGYSARVLGSNRIQLGADGSTVNSEVTTPIENVRTSGTLTLKDVTYPNTDGTSGQVLSTNGTGTISWVTPSTAVANSLTFATTGGATSGSTFNGSAAKTIDYSSVGASPAVGSSSITTVGTIGTGTWNGAVIAGQYGGTGVNNTGKTITLGGNLTTSGAFATTLSTTAATSVTLPTTGTLATLAGSETLSNKTLSAVILGTPTSGTLTNATGLPLSGITGSFTSGKAVYTNSTSDLTTGTLPTSAGGTGLTTFTNGGAVYASSTSALTTGTLPVASGGTGSATATPNYIFAGPATGSTVAAPEFRAMVAADIPNEAISYARMQKISTGKLLGSINAASAVPGEVTIGTGLSLTSGTLAATSTGTVTSVAALTLGTTGTDINSSVTNGTSTPVITLNIPDASATARGVVTTGIQTIAGAKTFSGNTAIGGTLSVTGVATLTAAPVLSSTTASQALFTDANKNVVSNAITGTGSVVMSSSPTFSGTVTIPTASVTGAITAKNYVTTVPAAFTAAATTTIDFSTGNIFKITLGMNITTLTITNAAPGTFLLEIIQGGTYTVAFPAAWKWSGGTAPTITATNTKTDIITIVYDGTTYFASAVQNF